MENRYLRGIDIQKEQLMAKDDTLWTAGFGKLFW